MQGSNDSRIGMNNSKLRWDDANWGGNKKNKSKGKNSSHQNQRSEQSKGAQTKKSQSY